MRVIKIETIRFAFQKNLTWVRIQLDNGITGLGETFFASEAVDAYIHETAAPLLLSLDDASPERVARELSPYTGYQGSGVETRGNSAIDIALWDAFAKSIGAPLYRVLGGPLCTRIPIYNTCAGSLYISSQPRQALSNWGVRENGSGQYEDLKAFLERPGDLAKELLAEGITGMKIWPFDSAAERTGGMDISSQELSQGIRIVEAIREAVGFDMKLMIELHGLWCRKPAAAIIRALLPYKPYWIEDPLRGDQISALIALKQETGASIALGETVTGRRGFLPLLQEGAIDVATLDIGWTGGITEAKKIASLADSFAVPIAPHDCTGPVSLAVGSHLLFASPNRLIQETVRAFYRTWYLEIADPLPRIEGSFLHLDERPGHGVELREDVLGRKDVIHRVYER